VVESVRSLRRIGPDGQVRFDLVAEVTQEVTVRADGAPVCLCGGSTLFIGPDGDVRLVVRKGVTNADRRRRQVEFLGRGLSAAEGASR